MNDKNKKSTDDTSAGIIDIFNNNRYVVLICNICTIAGLIVTLLSDNFIVKIITCVVFLIIGLFAVFRFFSYQRSKSAVKLEIASQIDNLLNAIRDYNSAYKNSFDKIHSGEILSYSHLDDTLKPLSNSIVKIAEILLGERPCVCMKLLETNSFMDSDINNWELRTIARSESTSPKRRRKDKKCVKVVENTDFSVLINGDEDYLDGFIVPDLAELERIWTAAGKKYKNSTKDFLRDYKSTIVFPIVTTTDAVNGIIKNTKGDTIFSDGHIIGFICLDSKKRYSDREAIDRVAEILESFADSLYPMLESYIVQQIERNNKFPQQESVMDISDVVHQ